jgi:nucleoside-diphosphate-sugar epimerase
MSSQSLSVITGVNGFIGSNLWRNLLTANGCGLVCNRTGDYLFFHSNNVIHYDKLEHFFRDFQYSEIVLYHCATKFENSNNPNSIEELIQGNFRYPFELIRKFSRFGNLHFVNLNSYWQALDNSVGNSTSNYAISKNLLLFNLESAIGSQSVTNIFLYDTYGFGDKRQKLVPSLVRCHIEKSRMAIASPLNEINLSHISDVVETIGKLGRARIAGEFQLSHPRTLRVQDVIEVFSRVSGQNLGGINIRSMSEVSKVLPLQIAQIPDLWNPQVSLEEGLKSLIQSVGS